MALIGLTGAILGQNEDKIHKLQKNNFRIHGGFWQPSARMKLACARPGKILLPKQILHAALNQAI